MEPKGNKMIFSERDQQIAKMPAEADLQSAETHRARVRATIQEVEIIRRDIEDSGDPRDKDHFMKLGSRLEHLVTLDAEFSDVIEPRTAVDRAIDGIRESA